ncbi:DUF2180 family protein [Streptomyces sp. NPDC001404]|uniref:DUF2180 family protein n=1 Tax=Streptomyces sp. NPDC001404 TaxID=3364571 RepID=UPI0036CCE1F8
MMRCFDCTDPGDNFEHGAAVALCWQCGAALCRRHLILLERSAYRPAGMGPASAPVPVRCILCSSCNRPGTVTLHWPRSCSAWFV